MEFEDYNRSFSEIVETCNEDAEHQLNYIRQQCVRDFINRLNRRQKEWELTFQDLLNRSTSDDTSNLIQLPANLSTPSDVQQPKVNSLPDTTDSAPPPQPVITETEAPIENIEPLLIEQPSPASSPVQSSDPNKLDYIDLQYFSNNPLIKEFVRIQEVLNDTRKNCEEITVNPDLKSYKNELNLFIRTQINSISNSDSQHLDTKTRLLTSLFAGHKVSFQDRLIDASQHPCGQLFAMDLAAQTFVTVGTRLVNSVPAIAKSMASVINGIIDRNFHVFKDLILGHLQERCPYLIPMHPKLSDFQGTGKECEVKYKIACGYTYDSKSQTLESEEKYSSRMRSMVLIFACLLVEAHLGQAWSWLAAFLSLKPQPVITATILQAFLQESSKKLSSTYGRQYSKVLNFIKIDYIKMIEDVTSKGIERQSLIKLKNLLADESNLKAAPAVGSIFGTIRFAQ